MPVTGFHGLPINPAGSVRIPLDLVVLPQRLRAHGPALNQEHLDLAQDQRVTFQRGGVMRLLMPDVGPDRLGLLRAGKPPETVIQLSQGMAEPFVDTGPTWSASTRHRNSVHARTKVGTSVSKLIEHTNYASSAAARRTLTSSSPDLAHDCRTLLSPGL